MSIAEIDPERDEPKVEKDESEEIIGVYCMTKNCVFHTPVKQTIVDKTDDSYTATEFDIETIHCQILHENYDPSYFPVSCSIAISKEDYQNQLAEQQAATIRAMQNGGGSGNIISPPFRRRN